ncbi:hypothetical protein BJF88_02280 [Cellulosimicrobium sp. CUA-896]|nr:hypothetical protein BJF88_02280 [Cellulosimicrobium sp. CUA-896]
MPAVAVALGDTGAGAGEPAHAPRARTPASTAAALVGIPRRSGRGFMAPIMRDARGGAGIVAGISGRA